MNKKKKLIPELRFSEFVKDGEWIKKTIEDVAQITTGDKNTQDKVDDGKYPFYVRSQTIEKINSFSYDGEAILTSGDGVGVGKIYHYRIGKFDFHQRVYCIYKFENEIEGKFVFYFFSKHFYNRVMQLNAKNSVDSVRRTMITEMPINVPPTTGEQQKIASCLSSLDEIIVAHNDKLKTLKAHKKGLMQNLFPQEGQKVPNYRFPEFEKKREWVEKFFKELFVIGNGKDYKHLNKGDISVYGSGGYMLSVDECLYDGDSACIGRKGTINKPMFLTGKFWTVDTLFYTHSYKDCIPKFIYYIFQNINWLRHNEAGGVPSLSKTNIYKIETIIPKPNEQQKIVSFLSELDDLIIMQAEKTNQLRQHKKGLMQGLFPKIEN